MNSILFSIGFLACGEKTEDSSQATNTTDTTDTTEDTAEIVGGACAYTEYQGMCTVEMDGTLTFVGVIEGQETTLAGNIYTPAPNQGQLATGSTIECSISYITQGTCTPCLFSMGEMGEMGECGTEAFAYMQNLPPSNH